jgi:hypothetical protein
MIKEIRNKKEQRKEKGAKIEIRIYNRVNRGGKKGGKKEEMG